MGGVDTIIRNTLAPCHFLHVFLVEATWSVLLLRAAEHFTVGGDAATDITGSNGHDVVLTAMSDAFGRTDEQEIVTTLENLKLKV